MQYEHTTRVGRYTVIDTGHATETLSDGSPGITSEELARLERRAAITVLSSIDEIDGGELKFARKALDLTQAELGRHLGVTTETICRWETGKEEFKRQTQLALLRLLEEVERHGEDALRPQPRTHTELTLRAKAS
jgi:DNA-binding transcriptional regulator YiaG